MGEIGWRSKEALEIQAEYNDVGYGSTTPDNWAKERIVKLLKVTHGQWLNRNVVVCD